MPFTASHAVAALPFLRTPLPASALVIGSMTPDLPYYLPLDPDVATHTGVAVVTYDLLLGAVAWALWHGLLAAPALAFAPAALRARLAQLRPGLAPRVSSASQVACVLVALVLGAGIHVLWDEFTHAGRWGAENVPALAQTWGPLPATGWLQQLSGLFGATVLLIWFRRWWRRAPVQDARPAPGAWRVWALLATAFLAVGGAEAMTGTGIGSAGFRGVTSGGGAALAVALLVAVGWHLRRAGTVRP